VEGFGFEMHVSIPKALLGLSPAAAATIRNLDATSDHRLEKRGSSDHCPKGQQAVTKPGSTTLVRDGCGTEIFASSLPFEKRFHECSNAHDRCYGMLILYSPWPSCGWQAGELTSNTIQAHAAELLTNAKNELKMCTQQQYLKVVGAERELGVRGSPLPGLYSACR
jgi:hypothetical protein